MKMPQTASRRSQERTLLRSTTFPPSRLRGGNGTRLGCGERARSIAHRRPALHNCGVAESGGERNSGCLGSQVQQAAKRTDVRAYLIRRNSSFIAALPIEKQCFHHFLAVRITNGFHGCAPSTRK